MNQRIFKRVVLLCALVSVQCYGNGQHGQLPHLDEKRIDKYAQEISNAVTKQKIIRYGLMVGVGGLIAHTIYQNELDYHDYRQQRTIFKNDIEQLRRSLETASPEQVVEILKPHIPAVLEWLERLARISKNYAALHGRWNRFVDCLWRESTLREMIRTTVVTLIVSTGALTFLQLLGLPIRVRFIGNRGSLESVHEYTQHVLTIPQIMQGLNVARGMKTTDAQPCFVNLMCMLHEQLERLLGYMTYRIKASGTPGGRYTASLIAAKQHFSQSIAERYLQIGELVGGNKDTMQQQSIELGECIAAFCAEIEGYVKLFGLYESHFIGRPAL